MYPKQILTIANQNNEILTIDVKTNVEINENIEVVAAICILEEKKNHIVCAPKNVFPYCPLNTISNTRK